MSNSELKLPLYSKLSTILVGLIALFYILYVGKDIIIPLVFATLLAILINPVVNFLTGKKINRTIAILLSLITAILILFGLAYFLAAQASLFTETFPLLKAKLIVLFENLVDSISKTFNVSTEGTKEWFEKMKSQGLENGTSVIGTTLLTISSMLVLLILLPVYIFFILLYKSHLLEFTSRLFDREKHEVVAEVLVETRSLIQKYLVGLLLEAAIVATLNSIGLLILGVQYAILIGIIGAILNIIPYVGGLVAITIPVVIALATQTPITALWVVLLYLIVQFIDNNIIVPKIVASKVKINGLVSIIVVLVGGALWGISGMFLSIPLIAIFKVIFDRIEGLKSFGFVLSEPTDSKNGPIFNFKIPIKLKKIKH
ncbi:MAG: AI-2E family transporter [Bacteroidia bacterium]|nr:AI-2E family transporter [Bacteroidia bacterium]